MSDPNKVEKPTQARLAMEPRWEVVRTLVAGTDAMRRSGEKFLPREPRETIPSYNVRINRSFLFPGYATAVHRLARRPFTKAIQVDFAKAPELEQWTDNVDLEGSDLTDFGHRLLETAIDRGLAHVLVDFPRAREGETLADERNAGRRPFLSIVLPDNVIGWRSRIWKDGLTLSQIRIKEIVDRDDGMFGVTKVERIRVFHRTFGDEGVLLPSGQPDTGTVYFRVYEKDEDLEWVELPDEAGTISIGEIPIVTFYTNRSGHLTASPPLWYLAEKNIEHWHSSSDQRNILRLCRSGILFGKMLGLNVASPPPPNDTSSLPSDRDPTQEDGKSKFEIGVNRFVGAEDPAAELKWVEHTGSAVGSGRQDLMDLKEEMLMLGLRPLIERASGLPPTATEASVRAAEEVSDMQAWGNEEGRVLGRALSLMVRYVRQDFAEERLPTTVYTDFGIGLAKAQDAQTLLAMRANGEISRRLFLERMKALGVLPDDLDVDREMASLQDEGTLPPPEPAAPTDQPPPRPPPPA